MTLPCRAGDMTVTSPRVAHEHCIRRVSVERAPRFVRDDRIAQRDADIERNCTVTERQELPATGGHRRVPRASRRVVGALHAALPFVVATMRSVAPLGATSSPG